jgi:hypothetical protein
MKETNGLAVHWIQGKTSNGKGILFKLSQHGAPSSGAFSRHGYRSLSGM